MSFLQKVADFLFAFLFFVTKTKYKKEHYICYSKFRTEVKSKNFKRHKSFFFTLTAQCTAQKFVFKILILHCLSYKKLQIFYLLFYFLLRRLNTKKSITFVTASFEPGLLSFQLISRFVIQHCKFDLPLTTAPEVFLFFLEIKFNYWKGDKERFPFVSSVKAYEFIDYCSNVYRIEYCVKL